MRRNMKSVNEKEFLADYFSEYHKVLVGSDVSNEVIALKNLLVKCQTKGKKAIIVGNGGSAAIASHCSIDFNKAAGIRCMNFNESSLITCLANDYGYEAWVEKALEYYAVPGDVIILISSSGKSPNMIRAAEFARSRGLIVVTFSGFSRHNSLRARGDINFWINSKNYNVIELFHQLWLLSVCDLIAEIRTVTALSSTKKNSELPTGSNSIPTAA